MSSVVEVQTVNLSSKCRFDRGNILRNGRILFLLLIGACTATGLAQEQKEVPPLSNDSTLLAEIANIRSLPPGYVAVCENRDLKLRSASSSTFVIRRSRLCAFWIAHGEFSEFTEFTVCSNDPEHKDPAGRQMNPECVELPRIDSRQKRPKREQGI